MANPYNWFFYLNPILTSPKLVELKRFLQNERQVLSYKGICGRVY